MTRTCIAFSASPAVALKSTIAIACSLAACTSFADTPLGWLEGAAPSAYTLSSKQLDLTIGALAVNDTIDFLDIRDELIAGNRRLEGDSGDLSGHNFSVQFGLASMLTAFYKQQNQDFTAQLGDVASINLLELDSELSTKSSHYGVRWNIYEAGHRSNDRPWHAMSLELSRIDNKSDDFSGKLDQIFLNNNTTVTFNQPQTFSVARLEDETLQAKLLYTWPMTSSITSTVFFAYSDVESESGTSSDITAPSLASAFEQRFSTDETRLHFGVGLNWQITERLPLQLSYEYIDISDSDTLIDSNPLNVLLPSFLRGSNLSQTSQDTNHVFKGSVSYWLTPKLNISAYGTVFSNQFLGVIPHFNNPLTSSFSDEPYGYAGISIGLRL
ncbi:MAG: outer membrane beta-barrel protein [Pseudohongiellaceae bacterium]|nr:outer membrane beta-barrel protein [Pseudohongiellaceae bacterium]